MPDFTPVSAAVEEALAQLSATPGGRAGAYDRILFSGNRHDALPRHLFLDKRLTPLERNAWQACRLMIAEDGITTQPTYEQLRPWLASTPTAPMASYETVARALTVLRLTRWLSLIRRRRAPESGRLQGNVYVLHDEPLSPFEAMQLEPGYLQLVSEALNHASKVVRFTAQTALQEIANDPLLAERTMPTRLETLIQRAKESCAGPPKEYPQDFHGHNSEVGGHDSEDGAKSHFGTTASESEEGGIRRKPTFLRNPKQVSTVSEKNLVRTVLAHANAQGLRLPGRFFDLKKDQQEGIFMALRPLEPAVRQAVLDEWSARCDKAGVRNPAGYLFGIVQKAIRGEFKPSLAIHGIAGRG